METKTPGDATPEELAIREVNTGIYAFDGGDLLDALGRLTPDNAQGEFYLPDVLPLLRAEGKLVGAHAVDDPTLTLGVNDRVDLAARPRARPGSASTRAHARAGVTIVDPASTLIDAGVEIGRDTVIEPSTFLRGATRIGERCAVGPLTTLIDTTVGDETRIVHSYLDGGELGSGVTVGPFAYLRPGARAARRRQGRHVRRDQELRHRRGHQGAAPLLHRRRRRRRGHQHRRRHDHRQLRRRAASTARRSAPASGRASTRRFVAPVTVGDDA